LLILNKTSSELRLVVILVAVTLAIGAVAIIGIPIITAVDRSGDTVDSYTVTLHSDGTLDETYTYKIVSTDTRFLFRFWEEAVVSTTSGPSWSHLEVVSITQPFGTTAYLKDDSGQVTLYSGTDSSTIQYLAYSNEVGAFNPGYYSPGTYTVSYKYRVYLPVDSDGSYDHFNLQFAKDHITYSNVKIVLEGLDGIAKVFPHPPSLQVSRSGGDIILTGNSPENELLEVEMLATTASSPWKIWGVRFSELNTQSLTESANQSYNTQYWLALSINLLGMAAVIIVPLLLFGLWYRFGREEDVIVPTYLSTVPNPERKPWYVNLIHNKGLGVFDENGFYATLLDLDNRGKIHVEHDDAPNAISNPTEVTTVGLGDHLTIKILDTNVTDAYENRIMSFLKSNATPDPTNQAQLIFDTNTLNSLASQINSTTNPPSSALAVQTELNVLMNPMSSYSFMNEWSKIPKEMFIDNSRYLLLIAGLGGLILITALILSSMAPPVSYLLFTPIILGVVSIIQVIIARQFPVYLMGRYKPGLYKEKLEWAAFRANLSEFSQIQKYGTADLAMWGSWLVFGTALGVGDTVAQAMARLNIQMPVPARAIMHSHSHFNRLSGARRIPPPVTHSSSSAPHRSSGGYRGGGGGRSGGGGHGGGGGRGGGGAGRR